MTDGVDRAAQSAQNCRPALQQRVGNIDVLPDIIVLGDAAADFFQIFAAQRLDLSV